MSSQTKGFVLGVVIGVAAYHMYCSKAPKKTG